MSIGEAVGLAAREPDGAAEATMAGVWTDAAAVSEPVAAGGVVAAPDEHAATKTAVDTTKMERRI
jgi:hypothetical protein